VVKKVKVHFDVEKLCCDYCENEMILDKTEICKRTARKTYDYFCKNCGVHYSSKTYFPVWPQMLKEETK